MSVHDEAEDARRNARQSNCPHVLILDGRYAGGRGFRIFPVSCALYNYVRARLAHFSHFFGQAVQDYLCTADVLLYSSDV